ncbi:MAG: ABC transporter ATP-binding protein, partial [Caulobacteraceae bacterium]
SRRALLDALNDYEGAVILITHDRSLMELVADRLWLAADGSIKPFTGDMDDYAKLVVERAKAAARRSQEPEAKPAPVAAPEPVKPAARPNPAMAGPLKRKLEAAETVLARTTAQLAEIDTALADPALYLSDPKKVTELGERREKAQAKVDEAEAVWMAAAEAYESATGV